MSSKNVALVILRKGHVYGSKLAQCIGSVLMRPI